MPTQHDYFKNKDNFNNEKFVETIGTLGTTTVPGGNQLSELKRKIREGVKHVELHLNSAAKGEFGKFDVPGKYGQDARRSIMQLAKMNKQTLSVHASLSFGSQNLNFAGLGQQGIDQAQRNTMLSEADETIKFAAETAKGGAIVFHVNDQNVKDIGTNFSKNGEDVFRDDPKIDSILDKLKRFKQTNSVKDKDAVIKDIKELKYKQGNHVFIGDAVIGTKREETFLDFKALKNLSTEEKKLIQKATDIDVTKKFEKATDMQKVLSHFVANNVDEKLKDIKNKILIDYETLAINNASKIDKDGKETVSFNTHYLDTEFMRKKLEFNEISGEIQKNELLDQYKIFKSKIKKVEEIEKEKENIMRKLDNATRQLDKYNEHDVELASRIVESNNQFDLAKKNQHRIDPTEFNKIKIQNEDLKIKERELNNKDLITDVEKKEKIDEEYTNKGNESLQIKQSIGQQEFEHLKQKDKVIEQIEQQTKQIKEQKKQLTSLPDKIKENSASSLGYLGIKAMKYQYDLLEKAEKATNQNLPKEEREKYRLYKDYKDIDPEEKPLYISPENMPAGHGLFADLDELKDLIDDSREEFAKKLMTDDNFKELRKKVGVTNDTKNSSNKEKAEEIAKRHIAATFDNAHAGTYFKHFKPENDMIEGKKWSAMSQESQWEVFNTWLNKKAGKMAEDGYIKHVHFNDTTAIDDDHNLLGHGHYNLKDLRDRLRKAGIKESFIVEAGNAKGHMRNAFEVLDVKLTGSSYMGHSDVSSGVSDWMTLQRTYDRKDHNDSGYGMGAGLTFDRQANKDNGTKKGKWSNVGFL